MRKLSWFVVLLVASSGCSKHDDAERTELAKRQLQSAEAEMATKGKALATNQDDIERTKRELARKQDELADQQKLLEQQRLQVGSAAAALSAARVAYTAAVTERLAKLDALLATLATKTDARSKDSATGLRPRRDQLAAKLATLTATPDVDWGVSTKDVDVTFEAIERDLHAALK